MYDGCAAYHVRRFPRPSPSVFAYWKRSKAGGVEGLGTRLSAIAAIEQQARVSQSPPSTSTSLESLATSPLTTSSSLPPRQALAEVQRGGRGAVVSTGKPGNTHGH